LEKRERGHIQGLPVLDIYLELELRDYLQELFAAMSLEKKVKKIRAERGGEGNEEGKGMG